MKLPEKIKGRNKIRDAKILQIYADGKTMEECGSRFNLTGSRIQQILYRNKDLLEFDKKYEKAKRINWLKRQLVKAGDSQKDSAELLEQFRKEIEGDDENFSRGSSETKVIVIYPPTVKENKLEVLPSRIEVNLLNENKSQALSGDISSVD